MSYILDALKKAELERGLGRVPRLESVQDSAPQRTRTLVWVITGALLVNAAVLAWWLRPAPQPVEAPVTQPIAPIQPPAARAAPSQPPAEIVRPEPPMEPAAAITSETTASPHDLPVTMDADAIRPAPTASMTESSSGVMEPVTPLVPLLRDLPADVRAAIPPLSLDVHVYAPAASGRFVLFNMKKFQEGDQLAAGLRIEEVTADGVVMSYQGQQFRIPRP